MLKMLRAFEDVVAAVPISGRDARAIADALLPLVDSNVYGEELAGCAERVLDVVIGTGGGDAIWLAAWIATDASATPRAGLPKSVIPKWARRKGHGGGEAWQAALHRLVQKSGTVSNASGGRLVATR